MNYENLIQVFSTPVINTNHQWEAGHTKEWFQANGYPIFSTEEDTAEFKHKTSYQNNSSTYKRLGAYLQNELYKDSWGKKHILDASSGRGVGTEALRKMGFQIEDIEPFYPDRNDELGSHVPPTYTNYNFLIQQINNNEIEKYDFIISNAVLNVLAQDDRDFLIKAMFWMLKPDGYLFINAPNNSKWEPKVDSTGNLVHNDVKQIITPSRVLKQKIHSGAEYYSWRTNSPQKSFSTYELKNYLLDAIGDDGYEVFSFCGSEDYPCSRATMIHKLAEKE